MREVDSFTFHVSIAPRNARNLNVTLKKVVKKTSKCQDVSSRYDARSRQEVYQMCGQKSFSQKFNGNISHIIVSHYRDEIQTQHLTGHYIVTFINIVK